MPVVCEGVDETPVVAAPSRRMPVVVVRIGLSILAVALVAGALSLLAIGAAPPPPARNPFGVGPMEAAPSAVGIGAVILEWQAMFYRALTATLKTAGEAAGLWALVGLSFAYGVFHAAGPGHGKGVVSAYVMADRRMVPQALTRGIVLSLSAALLQAAIALAVVGIAMVLLQATALQVTAFTNQVETVGFAAVAAIGLWLLWRRSGPAADLVAARTECADGCHENCGHLAFVPSGGTDRRPTLREQAGIVVAAGLRPCAGALIVLVFALSQGLVLAGVLSVLAMALGTALTTSAIAVLAVASRALALRLAGENNRTTAFLGAGIDLLAAAFVLVLGVALLMGLWAGGGGA